MIGQTVSHYKIVSHLGSGGMGVVYKAEDPRLGRAVALKFLPDDYSKNRQAMERFEREARAASSLHHPHICTIFDIGEHQGRPFIVMELLEGEDIRDRVARRPFQPDEFLEVAIQLADAFDAAHSSGIVHRDIKPANIMVSSRGHATLLDFGLAKLRTERLGSTGADELTLTGDPQLTNPGSTVGTIAYMSPEQVRGEEVDGRSDLFSFGAVLYEMIAGRPAFNGNTSGLLFDAVLNRAPVPIAQLKPEIPAGIPLVIDRALEKDRNVRYQTAADLGADLKRVRRDSSSRHAVPGAANAAAGPAASSASEHGRDPDRFPSGSAASGRSRNTGRLHPDAAAPRGRSPGPRVEHAAAHQGERMADNRDGGMLPAGWVAAGSHFRRTGRDCQREPDRCDRLDQHGLLRRGRCDDLGGQGTAPLRQPRAHRDADHRGSPSFDLSARNCHRHLCGVGSADSGRQGLLRQIASCGSDK